VLRAPLGGRLVVRTETETETDDEDQPRRKRKRKRKRIVTAGRESRSRIWLVAGLLAAAVGVELLVRGCSGV
jgi:hypothetical protein